MRYLDGAVTGDVAARPGKQLNRPDAARDAQTHRAAPLGFTGTQYLGALLVQFEDPGVRAGSSAALEPVEQLCGRVDLVVGKEAEMGGCRDVPRQIAGEPQIFGDNVEGAAAAKVPLNTDRAILSSVRLAPALRGPIRASTPVRGRTGPSAALVLVNI